MRPHVLLAATFVITLLTSGVDAANWFANPTGDDIVNDCLTPLTPCRSLQGAHDKAANGDTIQLAAGTYVGNLVCTKSLTFIGASAQTTIAQGTGSDSVVAHTSGSLQMQELTIRGGNAVSGGGVLVAGTSCRLVRCRLLDNISNSMGGAILNRGTLSLLDCLFSNNQAPGGSGGAIANLGQLRATNTTFSGNAAAFGFGGAIYQDGGTTTLANVTIVNNVAQGTGSGGGIYHVFGTINLHHVLLANNTGGAGAGDCANINQPFTSIGFNLIEDTTGCTITGNTVTDIVGVDPTVAALALNGGTTETHQLLPTSAAIDTGDPAGCLDDLAAALNVDQRGVPRPMEGNCAAPTACDIGAYEAVCGTSLAVQFDAVAAVTTNAGVEVRWTTLSEDGTTAFQVRSRTAQADISTLPTLVPATGSGGEYRYLDNSEAAQTGLSVAYQVVEHSVDGQQTTSPWFDVVNATVNTPAAGRTRR